MQILVPKIDGVHWFSQAKFLADQSLFKPFDSILIDFVAELSKQITLSPSSRQYPELIALAHWLRKAHILKLRENFLMAQKERIRLARGIVLHFAPANVDTIFVYSWLIALLSGNHNIIRLSSQSNPQIENLLTIIQNVLNQDEFSLISERTLILRFPHDKEITEKLSMLCNVRVIWGGDDTIKIIRQIPLSPQAIELIFPARFSASAFKASAIISATEDKFSTLIHNFYNDAFWFNQLACSSPKLIIWIGDNSTVKAAKEHFWVALDNYCRQRINTVEPALNILRLTNEFHYCALDNIANVDRSSPYFSRISIDKMVPHMREIHTGAGLFLEIEKECLDHCTDIFTSKDQTLSVYGFNQHELLSFIQLQPIRTLDRIVPVGQALNFQTTWDGYDLFHEFTREVTITF